MKSVCAKFIFERLDVRGDVQHAGLRGNDPGDDRVTERQQVQNRTLAADTGAGAAGFGQADGGVPQAQTLQRGKRQ
jgi:hypothetical protein